LGAAEASFIREYPLTAGLLAMSRVIDRGHDAEYDVFAKGAPEAIAQLCRLPKDEVTTAVSQLAQRGLRVLGVAHAGVSKDALPDSQRDFEFELLGFVGLEDPVRPSVPEAVRECHTAGIRVVMITGDYPATAHSIARAIGLTNPNESVTG